MNRHNKLSGQRPLSYTPVSPEEAVATLPVYDHLGMTEDQLLEITRGLWDCDPVLAKHADNIGRYERSIAEFTERAQQHYAEVQAIELEQDKLKAELRRLDTMRRETRGKAASMEFHAKLSADRIRQTLTSISKRRRQLYLAEAQRRLRQLGKELKLGRGSRAKRGLPTQVLPIEPLPTSPEDNENQTPS